MNVELITTGSELLSDRLNGHAVTIGTSLEQLGLPLQRQTSVGDGDPIRAVLREALERSEIIFVTGGLGPTSDDLTRDVAADLMGRPLLHDPEVEAAIRKYFSARNYRMPDSVLRQALVPEGAEVLRNPHGTAPGLILTEGKTTCFLLPGPPRELHPMWNEEVIPRLRRLFPSLAPRQRCSFLITGIGESRVQEIIEDRLRQLDSKMEIAYCASPRQVELRCFHDDETVLTRATGLIRQTFRRAILAENGEKPEEAVIRLAIAKGCRIATAESCTGGLVAHRLTDVPGSSAVLDRGWVTYSNESKIVELDVPAALIEETGAVSASVALSMARGAVAGSRADLAVSLTGIAGPSGGTPEKPVGLVFLGIAFRSGDRIIGRAIKKYLVPERETFKNMASQLALDLLRRRLLNWNKRT